MLNRNICMLCTKGLAVPDESVGDKWSGRFWLCPALKGFVVIDMPPPKGCHKLMEQGVAAARNKDD